MSENTWEGEIAIDIAGLTSVGLGKIRIIKLEEKKPRTVRICPNCGRVPERIKHPIQYKCNDCKLEFQGWFELKQAIPIEEDKGIPLPKRETKKTEKAKVKLLDLRKANLVIKNEYAVICLDDVAKENFQKLGAMIKEFKKAIVFELVFHKGGVRHLFYITVAPDNSLRAREIVPINKVRDFPKDIQIFVENAKISGKELKKLMDSIPEIKPEDLTIYTEYDKLCEAIKEKEKL